MALVTLTDLSATANRVGPGRYLLISGSSGAFFLGKRASQMQAYNLVSGDKVFLEGPFYYFGTVCQVHQLPDDLVISLVGTQGLNPLP